MHRYPLSYPVIDRQVAFGVDDPARSVVPELGTGPVRGAGAELVRCPARFVALAVIVAHPALSAAAAPADARAVADQSGS